MWRSDFGKSYVFCYYFGSHIPKNLFKYIAIAVGIFIYLHLAACTRNFSIMRHYKYVSASSSCVSVGRKMLGRWVMRTHPDFIHISLSWMVFLRIHSIALIAFCRLGWFVLMVLRSEWKDKNGEQIMWCRYGNRVNGLTGRLL